MTNFHEDTAPHRSQPTYQRRTAGAMAALITIGVVLGACGSSHASNSASSSSLESGSTTAPTQPVKRHVLVATFADNGGTLTVLVHDRIRVVLAGMSWTQQSSNTKVIHAASKASVLPASSGCVAGQGCGSVTVFYDALKTGQAQIVGSRGSCQGAAATCTTGSGAFDLRIVVTH